MPRISPDSIRRVREANDIVDLIGEVISLKRAGSAYKALCPFHKENTPSFTVSSQRQSYKCFGCGAGGSVVDFVMEFEKLEFVEAINRLAERAGITIEYEGNFQPQQPAPDKDRKGKLYEVMEWAQDTFQKALLAGGEAAVALEYLTSRGITREQLDAWGIGYARNSFDGILNAGSARFSPELLEEAGLVRRSESGKQYDFFRGRILFPIRDTSGRVVAFGGRKMIEDDPGGKYINSPSTPIYDKSRVLYGIHRLAGCQFNRARPKGAKLVVVVEGYFDVIACHAAGLDCALAPCGTAITPDQIRTVRRFADRIVLLMDGDAAGQTSMERIAAEVIVQGANVSAVVLPEGLDPDDYQRKHSAQEFLALLDGAEDLFSFKLRAVAGRHDIQRPAGRTAAAEEVLAVILGASNEVLRDGLLKTTSEFFDIAENILRRQMRKLRVPRQYDEVPTSHAQTQLSIAEKTLLLRLLTHPELITPVGEIIGPEELESPVAGEVYRSILNVFDEMGHLAHQQVFDHIDPGANAARRLLSELLEGDLSIEHYQDGRKGEFNLEQTVGLIRKWHEKRMSRRQGRIFAGKDSDDSELRKRLEAQRARNSGKS